MNYFKKLYAYYKENITPPMAYYQPNMDKIRKLAQEIFAKKPVEQSDNESK
jgi:hypothetical protein